MKKLILLLASLVFGTLLVSAQGIVEAIYLKNGSIVKGMIVEYIPGENVKIKTADGSIFVYPLNEIVKFTREGGVPVYTNPGNYALLNTTSGTMPTQARINTAKKYPHYQGEFNAGYVLGKEDYSDRAFLETIHGCRILPYLFSGAGIAPNIYYEFPTVSDEGEIEEEIGITLPIFLNLKGYYPVSEHFSVYASFDIGYSIGILEIDNSDVFVSGGFGINLGTWNLGFEYQSDQKIKGFGFKTGFVF